MAVTDLLTDLQTAVLLSKAEKTDDAVIRADETVIEADS